MEIDEHRIHYIDEGPRDAPVMLFAHPGPAWSFMWRNHIKALSKTHRCIAPDFPGYGFSDAAPGYRFTLREQAAALEEFVAKLDLTGITLWANDGGGPTGILVAGRHPERFDAFVLGGTFGWDLRSTPKMVKMLRFVSGPFFRAVNRTTNLLAWTMTGPSYGARKLSPSERAAYKHLPQGAKARNRPLRLFGSFVKDGRTAAELDACLARLADKKALFVFGDKDPAQEFGWTDRWQKAMPRSEVHMLPGVKHFTFEDAPDETLALYRRWASS